MCCFIYNFKIFLWHVILENNEIKNFTESSKVKKSNKLRARFTRRQSTTHTVRNMDRHVLISQAPGRAGLSYPPWHIQLVRSIRGTILFISSVWVEPASANSHDPKPIPKVLSLLSLCWALCVPRDQRRSAIIHLFFLSFRNGADYIMKHLYEGNESCVYICAFYTYIIYINYKVH
jgi:hypothetical protein